jgi:hypothetical protein
MTPLPPRPTKAEIARDPVRLWRWMEEYSDACLLQGLEQAIEEKRGLRDAAAIRARVLEPSRYPRLHLAGGKHAGRVGEARFKGRYHPHLIVDNSK